MITSASLIIISAVASTTSGMALAIPRTDAETASHRSITLPDATAGRIAVLVIGFSKKSKDVTDRWENRLYQDYRPTASFAVLRIAILESLPRMLRGFIRGRFEKNTLPERRDSCVLLFQQEDAWKRLVEYQRPDDAYLLLLDERGTVRWRGHGGSDLEGYDLLKAQIESLRGRSRAP
jgi:hypothetical protein